MKLLLRIYSMNICIVQLILLIVENIVLNSLYLENRYAWCGAMSISILVNIILQFLYFRHNKTVLSLGFVFVMLSYLFQESYSVLLFLDIVPADSVIYTIHLKRFGIQNFMQASVIGLNSIATVFMGYAICSAISKAKIRQSEQIEKVDIVQPKGLSKWYKNMGWMIVIIFTPVYYFSVGKQLMSSLGTGSYRSLFSIRTELLDTFINLRIYLFAGIYILMIYYKKNGKPQYCNALLLYALFSSALIFFTGARSLGMLYMVIVLLFWFRDIRQFKMKWKNIVFILIAVLILLKVLYAIRTVRQREFTIENFILAFMRGDNILYETFSEFGVSVFVTAAFVKFQDFWHPIDFFIKELFGVLPGIASYGGERFLPATVVTGIESSYGLGSTYIADFYYYFGKHGYFIIIFLGVILAMADRYMCKLKEKNNYTGISVMLCWSAFMLNIVRSQGTFNLKLLLYSYIIIKLFEVVAKRGKFSYAKNRRNK